MDQGKLHTAVQALLDLFGDDVPKDFRHEGQSVAERAESWIRHAVDESGSRRLPVFKRLREAEAERSGGKVFQVKTHDENHLLAA